MASNSTIELKIENDMYAYSGETRGKNSACEKVLLLEALLLFAFE